MIKKILLLLAFTTYLLANSFNVNDTIATFSLPDQFEKIHTINGETKTLIVSFEKGTGALISDFLIANKPEFLEEHHAAYIANISKMPWLISKIFALPKMQSYKHKILLINDENDQRFVAKEGKSTVYKLDNGVVKKVYFISSKEELAKAFE
jgi:hypothetical protein